MYENEKNLLRVFEIYERLFELKQGDNIPTLTATFSSVMHVSIGPDATTAPSIEQFAVVSGRGRGRVADVIL